MAPKDEELNKDEAEKEAEESSASEADESADESSTPDEESSAEETSDESEEPAEAKDADDAQTEPVATTAIEKAQKEEAPVEEEEAATPIQLGYRRYVYAAYMAGAIAVGFLCTKFIDFTWFKLSQWKPDWFATIGSEPTDEITVPLSGAIGIAVAVYYWRNKKTRTLVEEIAEELTRVTWPTRQEVTNSTTTVIIATTFATLFFALMDQFWLWVTKHVYGS
jgi:preprotein translocase SecE subunit